MPIITKLISCKSSVLLFCFAILMACSSDEKTPEDEVPFPDVSATTNLPEGEVVDSIHVPTGLVYAEGFAQVRALCTPCHSAKLITQNRATRDGWEQMIRWMQQTQGLWELGDHEPVVLDYLAAHYAPREMGRRANLNIEEIEWYILDLEE